MTQNLLILFLALILDRIVGDPVWMWSRIPHPVVLFGKAISALDGVMNRRELPGSVRKRNGVLAIFMLLVASLAIGWFVNAVLSLLGPVGLLAEVLVVAVLLAQKSLVDHVTAVADGLRRRPATGVDHDRDAVAGRCQRTRADRVPRRWAEGVRIEREGIDVAIALGREEACHPIVDGALRRERPRLRRARAALDGDLLDETEVTPDRLIVGVGLLVDYGIVLLENVSRHWDSTRDVRRAVEAASREVTTPLVAAFGVLTRPGDG